MTEEKKEDKDTYVVTEIPTQTMQVFHNTKTDENLDMMALLAKIANDLEKLKKEMLLR